MVRTMLADLRTRMSEPDPADGLGVGAARVSAALGELVGQREGIEDTVAAEVGRESSDAGALGNLVAKALLEGADARRLALDAAIGAYATAIGAPADVVGKAVAAVEIVTQALAPQVRSAPPPFRLLRLGPDNVSPLAPSAAGYGDRKLYGTRLGHFGAFGEESWRDWDWAWGRLDAAAQLGRVLEATTEEVRDLQQGVWDVEGEGRNLDAATVHVGGLKEEVLRRSFNRDTVDGLLDSAARMLGAEHAGESAIVRAVAPRIGTMLRTTWSPNPLWLFPGLTIRRKVRAWFG
jgi:hypothetical protein